MNSVLFYLFSFTHAYISSYISIFHTVFENNTGKKLCFLILNNSTYKCTH